MPGHTRSRRVPLLLIVCLLATLPAVSGCDRIYRLLQREGAEELDLLGEVVPYEFNARVMTVQKLLKLFGYRVGRPDGILGGNTRDAIEAFQKDNGLPASRFVDYATWDSLNRFADVGLVVNGDLDVKALQQALKNAGFNPGKIDGARGEKTDLAIVEFQKAHNLQPDGKVGLNTLTQLAVFLQPET